MLNEQKLSIILGTDVSPVVIKDVHWRTQDSDSSSLLFYRLGDESSAEKLFLERVATARYSLLIINRPLEKLPVNCLVIPETRWSQIQKQCLDELYPMPGLKLFGVTGTNGKTTTADLVLQLGEQLGKKGISIGTLGVRDINRTLLDFGLTSPPYIDLRKYLCRFGADKDFCVMEASSHALVQDRLFAIRFDAAGWLSFSQDHLDYHHSMEEYFAAKCRIIDHLTESGKLFVPTEQEYLFESLYRKTDRVRKAGTISNELPIFFQTQFNRNNLEVAYAMLVDVFGADRAVSFTQLHPPDGRFYIRPYKSNYIVVDFAHTPDALENICKGIREAFPDHHLKILFGCGGDRDRTKRPKMGSVAESWADEIYLTSDNPRGEDPEQILDDIVRGIRQKKYCRITERPIAVRKAFSELKEKEVLLLAGKGHEDYILIKGVKHPYSDIQEVENFLRGNLS